MSPHYISAGIRPFLSMVTPPPT